MQPLATAHMFGYIIAVRRQEGLGLYGAPYGGVAVFSGSVRLSQLYDRRPLFLGDGGSVSTVIAGSCSRKASDSQSFKALPPLDLSPETTRECRGCWVNVGCGGAGVESVGAGDEGRVVVVVAFERDDGKFVSVLANIASIVIGETGPFIKDWVTWNQVFLLVDIIRCCAIIFPLIWSIRSLFRQFYIVVIGLRGTKACTALAFVTLRADGEREFLFFRHPSADMLLTEAELDKNLIQKVRFWTSTPRGQPLGARRTIWYYGELDTPITVDLVASGVGTTIGARVYTQDLLLLYRSSSLE
ncbi:hypothetical protein Bca101_039569 [Brassica carinata]